MEIFILPVGENFLLYAPLHHLSALINPDAFSAIRQSLLFGKMADSKLDNLLSQLTAPCSPIPEPRTGLLNTPLFLGLIPTRGCNMSCRYCDFLGGGSQVMSFDTVRQSVNAYLDLLEQLQKKEGAIHFFGGEPFHAARPVQFAVEYARARAHQKGIRIHFEATTNGNYDERLAGWIAANIDTVVLSLDGKEDIQNLHRPLRNSGPSFNIVANSARIFSDGDCELIIRTCVSNHNVDCLPEIAQWISQTFCPSTVCFESLSASPHTDGNNIYSPHPLTYARKFCEAGKILLQKRIRTVLSTADLSTIQISSCPVGKDALIITPDERVNACYLLEKEWLARGMDMTMGEIKSDSFRINPEALAAIRQHNLHNKPLCADCFCRYNCAGGCHVHHDTARLAGDYDDQCIRTRLVTAAMILDGLNQNQLREEWLQDEMQAMKTARQRSDRITTFGETTT